MQLSERIKAFEVIFSDLQETTSLNMKKAIVDQIPNELREDFEFILECLAGKHIFGYKFSTLGTIRNYGDVRNENNTVKEVLQFLLEPNLQKNLTTVNIEKHVCQVAKWWSFFEQIVDRTLKLGIGRSLLKQDNLAVMLAKKYEGAVRDSKHGYFITEKLDGNRCVAHFDGTRWVFTSRNGKLMHVDFNMDGLSTEYVYDGEILSPEQVKLSNAIHKHIHYGIPLSKLDTSFNKTSGLINRHDKNKELVYNIFDIVYDDTSYIDRREVLEQMCPRTDSVRILPILGHAIDKHQLYDLASNILQTVVKAGGEGVMINLADTTYHHKRTDGLLKFKPLYSMDMLVEDIEYGTGKYEGMVGALVCKIVHDKTIITCKVGTGLSDEQRERWSVYPNEILNKIVQVGYFSLSQNSNEFGTNNYSLRFPRLMKVRDDKSTTSIY